MDDKNIYPMGKQMWRIFQVLKDLKWHCSECELPGSQPAKPLQIMRQDGFQMEKVGSNWEKRIFCKKCGRKTPHRRLTSLERKETIISRGKLPEKLKKRIRKIYNNKDEITGGSITSRAPEVDHRIPQIRWVEKERDWDVGMSNEEIEKNFMILSRENNLLKSRACEKCVRTGKRQPLLGIKFFSKGNEEYKKDFGCEGCPWHNPKKWKEELNEKLGETD